MDGMLARLEASAGNGYCPDAAPMTPPTAGLGHTGVMAEHGEHSKAPKGANAVKVGEILRVGAGRVRLADHDPAGTPGYPGKGKKDAPAFTAAIVPELADLQERLYAAGVADRVGAPSVLLVLQGMDTSGKGGVIRHVAGLVDPQGVALKAFKAPTPTEREHDFLWRIRAALPRPGMIGVFDRSHYEDVLVARVDGLAPPDEVEARYEQINEFEAEVAAAGTVIVKCMLHISAEQQRRRLLARLDNPAKHWKYNPGDVDVRLKWPAYQEAYELALARCNTDVAPWHVVPSDHEWYRNWAIARLLRDALAGLGLGWPKAGYDVAVERARVEAAEVVTR